MQMSIPSRYLEQGGTKKLDYATSPAALTVVPAQAGRLAKILKMELHCEAAVTVTFKHGAIELIRFKLDPAGTTGPAGVVLPFDGDGWYHVDGLALGAALTMELSAAVQVRGWLRWMRDAS